MPSYLALIMEKYISHKVYSLNCIYLFIISERENEKERRGRGGARESLKQASCPGLDFMTLKSGFEPNPRF